MKILALIITLLFLTNCDAVRLARTQSILIDTPHAEGARCVVTDARGRQWKVRRTPHSVAVEDGHSPLHIICKRSGYKTTSVSVDEYKEELLTIDGKRVTAGVYDQFPTKMPRLLPVAVKETASFVLDPTGNISTKYPDEVKIWMEPDRWQSKNQMLAWAYDKELYEKRLFIDELEAKEDDDERKVQRRKKKKTREEKREEIYADVKDFTKSHLKPVTYADYMRKTSKFVADNSVVMSQGVADSSKIISQGAMDSSKVLTRGAIDSSTIILKGSEERAEEIVEGLENMSDELELKEKGRYITGKAKGLLSRLEIDNINDSPAYQEYEQDIEIEADIGETNIDNYQIPKSKYNENNIDDIPPWE